MKMTIGVGVLGCGAVGAAVADRLQRERAAIERRSGVCYELRGVAIRDPKKRRPDSLDPALFTRDAHSVVDDPRVDLIVELLGGTTEAAELVECALYSGRHVVTANKDLLGTQGPRLRALAAATGAALRFEAAVAGAIPLLRTLDQALAGDEVLSVAGIVSGTCTTILSAMEEGASYEDALAEAQELGYTEADPSSDVDGVDAAHKLAVISQLAFRLAVVSPRIRRTGIAAVAAREVARARMLGLRIRLVAAVSRTDRGIQAEVAPVLVPNDHEFAGASGHGNVAIVTARDAGRLVLGGPGAGGVATCSAVMGDVVSVLRAIGGRHDLAFNARADSLEPAPDVAPFFSASSRTDELLQYPIWQDDLTSIPQALQSA